MDTPTLAAVIAGIVAIISAALTYRASSQANRVNSTKVDAEAYDRAQNIYKSGLAEYERQMGLMREQVDRLERQVQEEREVTEKLRRYVRELRETIARMERHIAVMRRKLQAAGIAVPEPPADDGDGESERDSMVS